MRSPAEDGNDPTWLAGMGLTTQRYVLLRQLGASREIPLAEG